MQFVLSADELWLRTTFSNMASVRHLGFKNLIFCKNSNILISEENFIIFHGDVTILKFSYSQTSAILDLRWRHNSASGNRF